MKSKNSNLVVGVIITVFFIILVGVIIMWTTGQFNSKKKTMDNSTNKIDQAIGGMSEFDWTVYEGNPVSGAQLVDVIKDVIAKKEVIAIRVCTLANLTAGEDYNYDYTPAASGTDATIKAITTPPAPTTTKTDKDYINPNESFIGKVIRNTNNEIICVQFTQQQ